MSQRAICLAVRDYLQAQNGWVQEQCDVSVDGSPKPMSDDWFVAIHEGGYVNSSHNSLDEIHSVQVTVTIRTGTMPSDRIANNAIFGGGISTSGIPEESASTTEILQLVKRQLNMDPAGYAVLALANAYIVAETPPELSVYGFSEPLCFKSCGKSIPKGMEWFSADPSTGSAAMAGLACTMILGDARRTSSIELQQ